VRGTLLSALSWTGGEADVVDKDGVVTLIAHSIDEPVAGATLTSRHLFVKGWVYSQREPISRVEVFVNDRLIGRAGLGRPRPEVALMLAAPDAELSGFELQVAIPSLAPAAVASIRLVAVTVGGRSETLGARDVRVDHVEILGPTPAPAPLRTSRRSRVLRRTKSRHAPDPIRVLWAARSLDTGGSQLRMAELVEHLGCEGGFQSTVLSPVEGPLRASLESSGAVVDVGGRVALDDPATYEADLTALCAWIKGRFDLVVGFTVSSFPVIDAARRLGVPSILRIGEAAPLSTVMTWTAAPMAPEIEARARLAFANASVLMSNSHAAVESYRTDGFDGSFIVVGTGVDVAGASDSVAATDREGTRRRLGIGTDERLLLCGASLWPVKGQALLVQALAQLHERHPALTCVLVGNTDESYAHAIRSFVSRHGIDGIVRILPFEHDLQAWWVAADVAVCTSESESLPAAVLEAMAFGLPVLSSRVGDVPLLIDDGVSGWLFDHSDLESLVAGLERVAATSPERRRSMGSAARRHAALHFDRSVIFDRIEHLLRTTATRGPAG